MLEARHPLCTPSHWGLLYWMALGENSHESSCQGKPWDSESMQPGMPLLPLSSLHQHSRKHETS